MTSKSNGSASSVLLLAAFILISIFGAVASITGEFLAKGGWMAMGYVITTAVFILVEINIYLLLVSARKAALE